MWECQLSYIEGEQIHRDSHKVLIDYRRSSDTVTRKGSVFRPPPALMQFVQTAGLLKVLDISSSKIPSEAVTALMSSLGLNPLLTGLKVVLRSCEFDDRVLNTLGASLAQMTCLSALDISDNGMHGKQY